VGQGSTLADRLLSPSTLEIVEGHGVVGIHIPPGALRGGTLAIRWLLLRARLAFASAPISHTAIERFQTLVESSPSRCSEVESLVRSGLQICPLTHLTRP
jgi:hypothetical protein